MSGAFDTLSERAKLIGSLTSHLDFFPLDQPPTLVLLGLFSSHLFNILPASRMKMRLQTYFSASRCAGWVGVGNVSKQCVRLNILIFL